MASYYDEYIKNNQKVIDAQKNAHLITRDSGNQIAAEKLAADNAALEESYGMQITNTEDTYESALKKNEVQKVLNERSIEHRMAEMGLTDSGLNRTQSTAVQLSYANQKGELFKQRQNALDTLAAAMRSGQVQNQLTYNASVAQNNAAYESNIASIDAQMAANASDYEAKMKQADIDAENARIRAQNDAIEKKAAEYNNLRSAIKDNRDLDVAAKLISDYAYKYDIDENSAEYKILLDEATISEDEMAHYLTSGSVYSSGSSYSSNIANKSPVGRVQWNYQTDGSLEYKFKLTKATWNLFGVDNNDQVTIYYPDGTLLAENVKIKQLPKDIRQTITDKTAKQKNGYEFTANVNLKGLSLDK